MYWSALLCTVVLVLTGRGLSATEMLYADENPAGGKLVMQKSDMHEDAIILGEQMLQRQSTDVFLDPVDRNRLIDEIRQVLEQLRTAYPAMAEISARRSHAPGTLLLGLDSDLWMAVTELEDNENELTTTPTGNVKFDALNAKLGLSDLQIFHNTGVVLLKFDESINLDAAYRGYQEIPGVQFAELDIHLTDGPNMDLSKVQETWYVIARNAWGDCPSGCIHQKLHFFTVEQNTVSRVETVQAKEMTGFAEILENRSWN